MLKRHNFLLYTFYPTTSSRLRFILCALCFILFTLTANAQAKTSSQNQTLKVGVAGTPPFVVDVEQQEGISLEIWQTLSEIANINYQLVPFSDVPHALRALTNGKVDIAVGPISITAERAERMKFTQPYFQSSLSILSRTDRPSVWERIKPFFSTHFFIAILIFLCILGIVGTLLWLAEREKNPDQFPVRPARGIANGMWLAIVTMSTVGYGDKSPVTLGGRIITGCWIIISILFATSMVAGIASTLTLSGMKTVVISTAEQLNNKRVGVIANSPAAEFTQGHGGKTVLIGSLEKGYEMLKEKQIAAVVYDRPQLLYFLKHHQDEKVAVSKIEYMRQGYGFAVQLKSDILHKIDINLLKLQESGHVDRIVKEWLGENSQ